MNAVGNEDDFSALFASEPDPADTADVAESPRWRVLLVDDAADVHAALRLTLQDMVVEGRSLSVLDAYSAAEAEAVLREHPDVALILLDVVMETHEAGFTLVDHVRRALGNRMVRIVLLTGQPGYALHRDVIAHYEIDDYRLKSELTADRIFACVYAELRTYQVLQSLEQKRPIEQLARDLQLANEHLNQEITERRRAQEIADDQMRDLIVLNGKLEDAHNHLLQSDKLASIGLLAAGVAHEINNPVGFVNSNLGTLRQYVHSLLAIIGAYEEAERATRPLAADAFSAVDVLKTSLELDYLREDVVSLLEESREGLVRVRKIVQSLKDFSRVDTAESWCFEDLHQGIESTLSVVWNELKYKCEVRREYGDLPPVECILSHLNQVFMNLLVNAAHAIHEHGVVTIRTGWSGDEVWVDVSDTGEGIRQEHLPHIFDPFFTTKPVGMGTGLGLSLSYGIVEKHHGTIAVTSEPGKGSTFRIRLPIRQPQPDPSSNTRG